MEINNAGDLVIHAGGQDLIKRTPIAYRRAPGVASVRSPPTGGGWPCGALHTTTVNLRTRLALLLGLLGAVASGAVALASYRVANGQLTAQVDVTLATYVQRLATIAEIVFAMDFQPADVRHLLEHVDVVTGAQTNPRARRYQVDHDFPPRARCAS